MMRLRLACSIYRVEPFHIHYVLRIGVGIVSSVKQNREATMRDFREFFAGGGMVRAGLGPEWRCVFANDFDHKKGRAYQDNWGNKELKIEDVSNLTTRDVPGHANLTWASFPCQDLSL